MKRMAAAALSLILLFFCAPRSFAAPQLGLTAESALLMDMKTGEIIYEKDIHEKRSPASTTKMLTCILAIENLDMKSSITVGSNELGQLVGNSLGLKADETMNTGNMIKGMMVASGNDAAIVLADRIAGSVDDFSLMMNKKLEEIGCSESHFVNPNGYHDDRQYSTCWDLAQIARYCMKNELFRSIVATPAMTIPETNKSAERHLSNTNLLLHDESTENRVYVNNELRVCKYEGCIGIKTGYTSKAGGCLVSACTRGDTTLLSVVMKSGSMERFSDTIKLFDWGFANYKTVKVLDGGYETGDIKVRGGKLAQVSTGVSEEVYATVPVEASEALLSTKIVMDKSVKAPFEAGTKVGALQVLAGDRVVGEADVLTDNAVEAGGVLSRIGIADSTIRLIALCLLIVILVLAVLLALYIRIERKKARLRKARKAARRAEAARKEALRREEWEKNYRNRYR